MAATAALVVTMAIPGTVQAHAEPTYQALPQSAMSVVAADSVEATGEGSNGPAALVLDGSPDTYWHTKWQGGVDPLPHWITIKLGAAPVDLARVRLLPRQSSNGSGRVNAYELWTSTSPTCADDSFTKRAEGSFDGLLVNKAIERSIVLAQPVSALCAKVVYLSSWGGSASGDTSPTEQVASLAEFNADILGAAPPTGDPVPITVVVPDGALEISDGGLRVRLHPAFPQVVDYRLGGKQLAGRLGAPLTTMLIDEVAQAVTVGTPTKASDGRSVSYPLTFANLSGVSMKAAFAIKGDALTMTLTDIVDPNTRVHRIRIPDQNIVTIGSASAGATLASATYSVSRSVSGDSFEPLASTAAGGVRGSYIIVATDGQLAAGFANNATEDNTASGTASPGRVQGNGTRWQRQITADGPTKLGTVWSGTWTVRGAAARAIGPDADPFWSVKITADANADGTVDWQDGAIALRDIRPAYNGMNDVKNKVITRIPFNIVSQATHPFLRTLDDTKRVSLATDNLGQQVMLKGYQDQGHDSAQGDYAGNYNLAAGGLADLKTLANEGKAFNANFGVHVNATESYSEARVFSEDLLRMPPQAAWGWMNQAYYMDGPKDLGTGNVLKRFADFKAEAPANLNWLYFDVYYPTGWENQRLGAEMAKQGWIVGSEWSDKFPDTTIWSHWSQEENYGGQTNKGINSQLIRFVENSYRDTFNPDPILSNSNLVEFEGWTGHNNYDDFIANVWQRNLPVKFLQSSDIMSWTKGRITFANGTVATSPQETASGSVVPTNRTFVYDGATVYTQGTYLLPWRDGGQPRLYHYNPAGGTTEWTLTNAFRAQTAMTLYKLTDTGRVKVADLPVTGGKVSIKADAATAYVLYPSTSVPAVVTPNWGQGSLIADPGFFSGTLASWTTSGDVSIEKTSRGNFQAMIGAGPSSLSQDLAGGNLPAGTWSAWAWIEVEPGKSRTTTVEVTGPGITPVNYQAGEKGRVATTINASTILNATASDEKVRTNFQRVRVTFATTGGKATMSVKAADGTAKVRVDDFRVVSFTPPVDKAPTPGTIAFQDFEHVDTGYWPFVTGPTNAGGDARTQLATLHAPYSQKGWYGLNRTTGAVEAGGKVLDNVLDGTMSLMAHEENNGSILRTTPASVPMKPGHSYKVSFDYQAAYDGTYSFQFGRSALTGTAAIETIVADTPIAMARNTTKYTQTVETATCDQYWFGVTKSGTGRQADLVIDNFRVEDLGASATVPTCVSAQASVLGSDVVRVGGSLVVQTTISSDDAGEATGVAHTLKVPDGWKATLVEAGAQTLKQGEVSIATWRVVPPATVAEPNVTLTFTGAWAIGSNSGTGEKTLPVTLLAADDVYLSDMRDSLIGTPTNGWGPVEWDMSNGENAANDGTTLSIGGRTFAKGIGAHAVSTIAFDLGAKCTRFNALVGVDGEMAGRGTVIFEVVGDGKTIAGPTVLLRGGRPAEPLTADVTGVTRLELRLTGGVDGIGGDHGDWALARVACGTNTPAPAVNPKVTLGSSSVAAGGTVKVSVSGYHPTDDPLYATKIVLHSTPVQVGTIEVASDGTGTATVTIPADTAPGAHTLEVAQVGAGISMLTFDGAAAPLAISAGTTPPSPSADPSTTPSTPGSPSPSPTKPGNLPSTGGETATWLLALVGLASVGVALVARRRRSS